MCCAPVSTNAQRFGRDRRRGSSVPADCERRREMSQNVPKCPAFADAFLAKLKPAQEIRFLSRNTSDIAPDVPPIERRDELLLHELVAVKLDHLLQSLFSIHR